MKVTYTKTTDIDLDLMAEFLGDNLFDWLGSEYNLDINSAYQIFPQIQDELWENIKEYLKLV